MKPSPWTLKELARWAQWGCVEERIAELLRPQDLVWPEQEAEFAASCRLISAALPDAQHHLLPQALAAALLTRRGEAPEWLWPAASTQMDWGELSIGLATNALLEAKWGFAPLALASEAGAQMYWGLLGLFKSGSLRHRWPSWWERTAHREAVESAAVALELARKRTGRDYFFWPLLSFRDRQLVVGGSIGLPIFLAAWALDRGVLNESVAATGRLSASGEILPVGCLQQKAIVAEKYGLKALLHPCGTKPVEAWSRELELIEVTNIKEACLVFEAFSPGKNQQLLANYRTLASAEHLSCSLHLLTPAVLINRQCSTRYAEQVLSICADPILLGRAVQSLEHIMNDTGADVDLLELLLRPFCATTLRRCAAQAPASAFSLAQMQLALANRQGRIDQSRQWCELSNQLVVNLAAHPEGIERHVDFINRRLIHEHHNRFDFCPELPPWVLTILHPLEKLAEASRQHFGDRATPVLGRLYGTLAQHYGFCGPDYLSVTLRYADLARHAFGDGRVPEYRDDWQRQENYRSYALLDAGLVDEARLALSNYVGFDPDKPGSFDFETLSAYQHAALARFCFETRQASAEYAQWCRLRLWDRPPQHPWQLWCSNVATFLNDEGLRKTALEKAVEICRRQGATVQAMALLPLEQLWRLRLANDGWLAVKTDETLRHLRRAAINGAHFAELLRCGNWQDVLQKVAQARTKLFPFSYR